MPALQYGYPFGGALTLVFGLVYTVLKKSWRTVIIRYLVEISSAVYSILSHEMKVNVDEL